MMKKKLLIALPVALLPTHNYIVFAVVLIFYAALTPCFIGLINVFYVYPVLKKYMIDNTSADKSEKKEQSPEPEPEEEKKTGHFDNGMWVYDE